MSSQALARSRAHRDEVRPGRSIELKMYNKETSVSPLPPLIPSPLQPLLVSFLFLSKLLDTMVYAHFYLTSHTHSPTMVFTPATYSKPLAKSMVGRILLHDFYPLVFTPVIILHYMAEGTLQM